MSLPLLRPSKGLGGGARTARISHRLILLVAVPLVVAVAFAGRALAPSTGQAVQAVRLEAAIEVAQAASDLTYRLQRERAEGSVQVTSAQRSGERFGRLARATDESVARYREKRAELSSMPSATNATLQRIDKSLDRIASLRAQVRSGAGSLSFVAFGYRIAIADLVSFRDSIAQADGVNAEVADHIRAAAALSEAAEHVAQQEVAVVRALSDGGFTPASLQTFEATRLGYTDAYETVTAVGPEQWRTWMERTLSGPRATAAEKLAAEAARSAAGERLAISRTAWTDAMADRQELLRSVVLRADADLLDTVTEERTRLTWWAVSELALVVLMLVAVLLIAVRLGRDLIRRLRDLRDAAHEVAHKRLPEEVHKLAQLGSAGRATPDEIAQRAGTPLANLADDEMGEVGQAFNSVHYVAVRLAGEQAQSRDRFAETLVTVARRGARLNSALTAQLNRVQRDELDPKRMETLFALDHLAIRMEHNANNLLVLGGVGGGKVRPADAPCTSVIYAAAQQIEHYGRVSLGHVDPAIAIAARVVDDIAHMLAELLDNAARFSPPDTQVGVAAWSLRDRAVLQIVDEGIGMPDARRTALNGELASPQADIGAVHTMGLQVVGRIAARHGIVVELRESSGPGTIVEVALPKELLAEPDTDTLAPVPPPHGAVGPVVARDHTGPNENHTGPNEGEAGQPEIARSHDEESGALEPAGRPQPAIPVRPQGSGGHLTTALRPRPAEYAEDSEPADRAERAEQGATAPSRPGVGTTGRAPGSAVPVESRIAGVSASGLPIRKRAAPGGPTPPTPVRPAAGEQDAATRARKVPRRRDSRQVSDVFSAYAQGISRSTRRSSPDRKADAGGTTGTQTTGTQTAGSPDDSTQGSTR
ncbi:sensor histidine kinase [Streptomyces boluensis]|uniref:histidine kinase n=1 Tax=Streptomyces boluensis TaxID=1775135 RepID=A0A964UT67_9ACTN|nr:nitrate- and nitrite sensing domain-containing protein [Streptomyces boluensis]NBE54881.1 histidine kinase [Streptomyces boluensis]